MNIKQLTICLVGLLGLALTSATPVYSQTLLTQTQTMSFSGISSSSINLNFLTFNSTTGSSLVSVQVFLEGVKLSGTANGVNDSGTVNGGLEDLRMQLTGTLDVTAVDSIDVQLTATSPFYSQLGVSNVPPNNTITHTFLNVAGTPSNNSQEIDGTPFAYPEVNGYKGDGTSTVTVTVTPSFFGVTGLATKSSGSTATVVNGSFGGSATASGTVRIVYTYAPVPEPTETAAWMLGLAVCVMVGRKYFPRRNAALKS